MGKLLCEKNLRDVWCRNESVRAEIGQFLQTHRHTHASKISSRDYTFPIEYRNVLLWTLKHDAFVANSTLVIKRTRF